MNAISAHGSDGLDQLVTDLRWGDAPTRSDAATSLGVRGETAALADLIDAMSATDGTVREAAATALGLLGNPDAGEDLVAALDDPDPAVARAAALSLTRMGDPRGPEALWPLLEAEIISRDDDERAFAARMMGVLGDGRACRPLMRALADPCADVRADAAEALGKLGDTCAMAGLLDAGFRDGDPVVRDAAMFALARMTAHAAPAQ